MLSVPCFVTFLLANDVSFYLALSSHRLCSEKKDGHVNFSLIQKQFTASQVQLAMCYIFSFFVIYHLIVSQICQVEVYIRA